MIPTGRRLCSNLGVIGFSTTVPIIQPMKWAPWAAIFLLTSCVSLSNGSDDTLAPLTSITPPTVSPPRTPAEGSEVVTSPPRSAVPDTTDAFSAVSLAGAFPSTVPSERCTAQAIGSDHGITPESSVACAGPWAITRVRACPPETECEGLDVFRWTGTTWQHRGFLYSLCAASMDDSGLPRWAFDRLLGFDLGCDVPVDYRPERPTGPLQLGDFGPRTREIQNRLVELGLLEDRVDGYFGRNTRNAVIDLQFLLRVPPDGIVDATLIARLGLT